MNIIILILAVLVTSSMGQGVSLDGQADEAAVTYVTTSSRDLAGEEKLAWIDSMRKKLVIASRVTGPFGMAQDPNAMVAKLQEKKVKKGAFLEAVAAIQINTVMPLEKKFTSSSREFSAGDIFPVIKNQRQFNVEVIDIKTSGIIFKNIDTGEQVRKNLNSLPAGMKQSAHLDDIPGVFPANRSNEMPLILDEDEPLRVIRQ